MMDIVKTKKKMKEDPTLKKMVLLSKKDEILLDLDGDCLADAGLMDSTGDGRVDTLAIDLTGDNEFNLYFMDTRNNNLPDVVFYDEESNGDLRLVGIGEGIEGTLQAAAARTQGQNLFADPDDSRIFETPLRVLRDEASFTFLRAYPTTEVTGIAR